MINNRFETYLVEEQESRLTQISEEINSLYSQNGYKLYQKEINSYASLENIYIEIKDLNDNTLYSSNNNNHMNEMGAMHRRMMQSHKIPEGNYVDKAFPLFQNNKVVAKLIIGYIDNSYLTESAIIFKSTLAKSFFISGIFTIILGILISIYLSKSLTNPLITIRDTAVEIQKGNLSAHSKVNTNTLEIAELSDSINYLSDTLSKQEDIRKRYASDISHELRTPITTLKSHVEAIMDGVWNSDEEHLNILMLEINRLSGLVDNLKDSFTSEEYIYNLNKTKFNLSKEMHNIIHTFLPIYHKENYSINFSIEDNIEINMDKDKLKQIMYNLLANSIKYLDDKGEVYIELTKSKESSTIRVIDKGIGIKKEDLPRIFDRFYRSDSSRNRNTGGTGLGLSIVQTIIKAHNGSIHIDSVYGKGTEIIIILPLGL
jgi:signal transduction histidine kinase